MDHKTGEEAPPSTDLAGWRRAVGDGSFRAFNMESVIAAIEDLGPTTDKAVLNPLVLHVSDTIIRRLRGLIGRNHRNEGEDMITRAHAKLVAAMFNPASADGKGMRVAFGFRVSKRAADGSAPNQDRETRIGGCGGGRRQGRTCHGGIRSVAGSRRAHGRRKCPCFVTDDQKRLAFRLYMEGVPVESTRRHRSSKRSA